MRTAGKKRPDGDGQTETTGSEQLDQNSWIRTVIVKQAAEKGQPEKSRCDLEMGLKEEKMRGRTTQKAQITVEAALLMTLIIPLLVGVLLAGFYVHDRAFLQAVCTEVSAAGSNLLLYDDRQQTLDAISKRRSKGSMMWTKNASVQHTADETVSDASSEGTFTVPGLVTDVFGLQLPAVRAEWKKNIYHPAELIWTVRSVKYVVDLLED